MLSIIAIAVIGSQEVRAAYGIGVGGDVANTRCITCIRDLPPTTTSSTVMTYYVKSSLPSAPSSVPDPDVSPSHLWPEEVSYMPPAASAPSTQLSSELSTPVKAGIIAASIIVFFVSLLLILEYTYLRRKRHDRAVNRAINEVEQGTELKESNASESKENMVLESRVEIVVEEEEQSSVRDSWDRESPWDAGTDGEDSDGDLGEWGRGRRWERGRNGMSLPRTENQV